MLLQPSYDSTVLVIDVVEGDPAIPLLRQRRRLGATLAGFTDEQWAAPTRCEGWSTQDVISHLVTTNQFWAISMGAGFAGEPTRFLATFDPVASPASMVEGVRHLTHAEVLTQYDESVEALAAVITGLDDEAWAKLGEAPPGHVGLRAVAAHALWDAWVHERDVLLPLGLDQELEDDEILLSLRYAAALGPAFARAAGERRTGRLAVAASDPSASFVVDIGDVVVVADGAGPAECPTLTGDAVAILEGLSFRVPLEHTLGADDKWMLGGLDAVFDRV